jgi:hypothetical protein
MNELGGEREADARSLDRTGRRRDPMEPLEDQLKLRL